MARAGGGAKVKCGVLEDLLAMINVSINMGQDDSYNVRIAIHLLSTV
jgi:hypothetical protein